MCALASLQMNGAATHDFAFSESTPLASGKWVKISINETGVYEITYDQLLSMGFSDPSKVALFGTGGTLLNFNFTDDSGRPVYSDSLTSTPVLHTGSKLIFYGGGTESISAMPIGYSQNQRLRHRRMTKNIYSDRSYYLLTDSYAPESPAINSVADKSACEELAKGYGYIYHERDLRHNMYNEGQVFWGEEIFAGKPATFDVQAPYCIDAPAHLWMEFATAYESGGEVSLGLNGATATSSVANRPMDVYTIGNSLDNTRLRVNSDGIGSGTINVEVSKGYSSAVPLAIDYWTLSYPIDLSVAADDPHFTSQYAAFIEPTTAGWRHRVPENAVVWDVSVRRRPVALEVENGYVYHTTAATSEIVAFNPDRQQLAINPDWTHLANQNLHGMQSIPVDMAIITLEKFRPYAERIADAHRQYAGHTVVVVTPEEIYNEFNHGTPDVTALRAFVKMLYQANPATMRNVLLLGGISADFRKVNSHPDRPETFPVYMVPKINLKRAESAEGSAAPDYIGIVSDYINASGILSASEQRVGVGMLPIQNIEEAETVVKKITDYLSRDDFSNLANEFMTYSDEGDSHIHDFQSFRLTNLLNEYISGIAHSEYAVSPIWYERLGANKASADFLSNIRRGKLLSHYYGHAGAESFANITCNNVMSLDNPEPAFLFLGACDLCEPDRGKHGVGDLGVIRNSRGLSGVVCATRSVLSHENQALAENFVNSLFYDANRSRRTGTVTIGEIYADARTKTNNVSKQAYVLIGDPGLPLPVALGRMSIATDRSEYRGGEVMEVSGQLLNSDGTPDTSVNGYVTVKLMEPKTTEAITSDPVNDYGEIKPNPRLVINDYRLNASKSEVRDGRFTTRILIPKRADSFLSTPDSVRTLTLLAAAYDPATRNASSGVLHLTMPMIDSTPDESSIKDTQAPSVAADYDNVLRRLNISAADETGLIPGIGTYGGVTLSIDGKSYNIASGEAEDIMTGNFSTGVSTASLSSGRHTARITATDAAGNMSGILEYPFEITDIESLRLTVESPVALDMLTLRLENPGTTTPAPLMISITDRSGNLIASREMTDDSLDIDVSEFAAGTYTASLRAESAHGVRINSNRVEFTKID